MTGVVDGNRNFAFEFYGDAIKLANGEELNRGPAANAELAGEEDVKNAFAPTSGARKMRLKKKSATRGSGRAG